MKISVGNLKIKVDIMLCVILLCVLLNKDMEMYFSNYITCLLFTAFHEFAHIFVASIFGKKVSEINFTICGLNAKIVDTDKLQPCWLLVYLAGPISNLLLAILTRKIYLSFSINIALFFLNMLPLYPLDGFKIFNLILKWYLPNSLRISIIKTISIILICLLAILGVLSLILSGNPSIIIIVFYVINIYINYQ